MASKLRLKASTKTSPKARQSLRSNSNGPYWQRGKLKYDGITVTIENTQCHKVKPMLIGPEPVQMLGTVDPSTQTNGRIYYLTAKYWSQLNPWSFERPNAVLDDNAILHEIPRIERNSYRYEPLNAGVNDTGHPDNVVTEFQKDEDGNLTDRRKLDSEKKWTVCYPAVEKKTIPIDITNKCQIVIPAYVVDQFRAMMKAEKKAIRGRGRPKVQLLDEVVRLLAMNHVPVTYQVVDALVSQANEKRPTERRSAERSIHNAFNNCGLVRMDTLEGLSTGVYGLPDLSETSMTHFAQITKRIRGRLMTDHNDRQITAGHDFDYLAWARDHPVQKAWDGVKVANLSDLPECKKPRRSRPRPQA